VFENKDLADRAVIAVEKQIHGDTKDPDGNMGQVETLESVPPAKLHA
jgi:hypothetical protein